MAGPPGPRCAFRRLHPPPRRSPARREGGSVPGRAGRPGHPGVPGAGQGVTRSESGVEVAGARDRAAGPARRRDRPGDPLPRGEHGNRPPPGEVAKERRVRGRPGGLGGPEGLGRQEGRAGLRVAGDRPPPPLDGDAPRPDLPRRGGHVREGEGSPPRGGPGGPAPLPAKPAPVRPHGPPRHAVALRPRLRGRVPGHRPPPGGDRPLPLRGRRGRGALGRRAPGRWQAHAGRRPQAVDLPLSPRRHLRVRRGPRHRREGEAPGRSPDRQLPLATGAHRARERPLRRDPGAGRAGEARLRPGCGDGGEPPARRGARGRSAGVRGRPALLDRGEQGRARPPPRGGGARHLDPHRRGRRVPSRGHRHPGPRHHKRRHAHRRARPARRALDGPGREPLPRGPTSPAVPAGAPGPRRLAGRHRRRGALPRALLRRGPGRPGAGEGGR